MDTVMQERHCMAEYKRVTIVRRLSAASGAMMGRERYV